MFNWLTIELTNRCNKACWFCGRNKSRKEGTLNLGHIQLVLFKKILSEYKGTIIQYNSDGEPLLYPALDEVADLCKDYITNIVTNGKLLLKKAETVAKFSSVCVSVFENDEEQYENVKEFRWRYPDKPVVIKYLGNYEDKAFNDLGVLITRRTLHDPQGDWKYKGSSPVIPELGICLEIINKPSVSWDGKLHICNRFDPNGEGIIGDCNKNTLEEIWNSDKREEYLKHHLSGNRDLINFCGKCSYFGFPVGG